MSVHFAVLASLDAASSPRPRSTAPDGRRGLAEQEPSACAASPSRARELLEGDPHRHVGKSDYQISSDAEWVTRRLGRRASCDSDGKQADYIRITSDVRSSVVGKNVKPVR